MAFHTTAIQTGLRWLACLAIACGSLATQDQVQERNIKFAM